MTPAHFNNEARIPMVLLSIDKDQDMFHWSVSSGLHGGRFTTILYGYRICWDDASREGKLALRKVEAEERGDKK